MQILDEYEAVRFWVTNSNKNFFKLISEHWCHTYSYFLSCAGFYIMRFLQHKGIVAKTYLTQLLLNQEMSFKNENISFSLKYCSRSLRENELAK